MGIKDGFMFGLGLWFATIVVGTLWIVVTMLIIRAVLAPLVF